MVVRRAILTKSDENMCVENKKTGLKTGSVIFFAQNSCTYQKKAVTLRPETKKLLTKDIIMAYKISEDCIACGTCIDECPMGAISEGEHYSIDPDICTECGTCESVCPSGAISL